jgi:hypothetical protein
MMSPSQSYSTTTRSKYRKLKHETHHNTAESPGSVKAMQSRKLKANDPKGKEKVSKKKPSAKSTLSSDGSNVVVAEPTSEVQEKTIP